MTFTELSLSLKIPHFPPMETFFREEDHESVFLTREALLALQERYRLFGPFEEDVLRGYEDLLQKPEEIAWLNTAARFLMVATEDEAKAIPFPAADGSPSRDMLPLFLITARVEWAIKEYQHHGFSQEEAIQMLAEVTCYDIHANIRHHGRPGIDRGYFNWTVLYLYCVLFPCRGFQFNFKVNPKNTFVFRHRTTGETAVFLDGKEVHPDGMIAGTAGYPASEDSFLSSVTETEEAWLGNPISREGRILPRRQCLLKSEWELALSPGDETLGIHIPRGTDLTEKNVREAIEAAYEYASLYYGRAPKAIHCSSWLLCPDLAELAGEGSKVAQFGNLFTRFPVKSDGKSVFEFVFYTRSDLDLEELAENTSLQRAIKKRYLAGGYVHIFAGLILR